MEQSSKASIFVLMPFKRELDNTFYAIQRAAERIGATVERADNPVTTELIMRHIQAKIERADLVLADLTDQNPNVFYEVGYAHAAGKPVALLCTSINEVPFDLRSYPILEYQKDLLVAALVERVAPYLTSAINTAVDGARLRVPLEHALRNIAAFKRSGRLFEVLLEGRVANFSSEMDQWVTGNIRVGPHLTLETGTRIINNLAKGGFATFLVPVESYWLTGTDYLEAARRAARDRGKKITRVYIVFDESSLDAPSLRECIEQDAGATIETLVCLANRVTDKEAIRDFGIWDDELVALVEVAKLGVLGCEFTTDAEWLKRASRWRSNILAVAEPARVVLARFGREDSLHQPLVQSATRMKETAETWCRGGYIDSESCEWYHGSWQYLRIVNAVSTPDWHSEFYRKSISDQLTKADLKRLLICGCADYGMLAHVGACINESANSQPEIVVLDSCETPLRICEWFADRVGLSIRTLKGNALDLDFRDDWFDLVVTDAFLTRFEPKDRASVVREWWRVLRPGGAIITTMRIGEGARSQQTKGTESDVEKFVRKTKNAAYRESYLLPCSVDQMGAMAENYARKIVSWPLGEPEIPELFAGFMVNMETATTPGELRSTKYARVRALKAQLRDDS